MMASFYPLNTLLFFGMAHVPTIPNFVRWETLLNVRQTRTSLHLSKIPLPFQRVSPCPGVWFPGKHIFTVHDFRDSKPSLSIVIVISLLVDCQRQQFSLVILKFNFFFSSFEFSDWKVIGSIKLWGTLSF